MQGMVNSLRRHRNLILLLISGLVALLTELAGSWLDTTLGRAPSQLIRLLAIGALLAVALWAFYLALGKRPSLELVPQEERPSRFPGLIVLVGPGRAGADPDSLSHNPAIEYHLDCEEAGGEPLRVCWLITTAGEQGGLPVAQAVRRAYQDRCEVLIRMLRDAFSLQEAHRLVHSIYTEEAREHGLEPEQVIADFTGGTKPMSAGMALACQDRWPMQYMTGGKDPIASIPISEPFSSAEEGS